MRIIAGEFKRRLLKTPPDDTITRPIPDRVKESLFMILRGHCEDATVFDGFAGTGAIGLEAVSRGARKCVLVEKDRSIAALLKENVATLGADDRCEVLQADALGPGALARAPRPLHLAFLDPPYPLVRDRTGLARVMEQMERLVALLDDTGFAVLRTPWPLRFEVGGEQAEPQEADEPRKRKKKVRERDEWKREQMQRERDELRGKSSRAGSAVPPEDDELGEMSMDGFDDETAEFIEAEDIDALIADEAASEELAADEEMGEDAPPAPKQYEAANLVLPNAEGPETHVYHGMAIHLYMRKKAASSQG
jgi:16S rRNA (guanine(966)-N(2))-methyltransferase RsmD